MRSLILVVVCLVSTVAVAQEWDIVGKGRILNGKLLIELEGRSLTPPAPPKPVPLPPKPIPPVVVKPPVVKPPAPVSLPSPTPRETLKTKLLHHTGKGEKAGTSDFRSPIYSYRGNTYYTWVNNKFEAWIAKRDSSGRTKTHRIMAKVRDDDYHSGFSLGIDKNGYIHVTGNMHHSPQYKTGTPRKGAAWWYWVSNKPEDISSFYFAGDDSKRSIPGTSITYPNFARDRNGELYVAFRHRVKFSGWSPGTLAFGVAKYDSGKRSWEMLGGRDYPFGNKRTRWENTYSEGKTLFWNNTGYKGTAYQGYTGYIFFDARNRMHVTWGANDGLPAGGGRHSHILYTYSDDGGKTFRKANGQAYSKLPIQLNTADVVARIHQVPGKAFWYTPKVGVGPDGKPIVATTTDITNNSYFMRWTGSSWDSPRKVPLGLTAAFYSDKCGVITGINVNRSITRSTDGGKTWQSYGGQPGMIGGFGVHFDPVGLESGVMRYMAYHPDFVNIYQVDVSGLKTPCAGMN